MAPTSYFRACSSRASGSYFCKVTLFYRRGGDSDRPCNNYYRNRIFCPYCAYRKYNKDKKKLGDGLHYYPQKHPVILLKKLQIYIICTKKLFARMSEYTNSSNGNLLIFLYNKKYLCVDFYGGF